MSKPYTKQTQYACYDWMHGRKLTQCSRSTLKTTSMIWWYDDMMDTILGARDDGYDTRVMGMRLEW